MAENSKLLEAFNWVGNTGEKASESSVTRQRKIAEALGGKFNARTPQNAWEGIDALTAGIVSGELDRRSLAEEERGREEYNAAFGALGSAPDRDALMGISGMDFGADNQDAVVKALLAQSLDPMAPLQLEKAQLELEAMRNPQSQPPELEELYDPDTGLPYKASWNTETGQWDRQGGVKAPSGTSLSVDPATGAVSFSQGTTTKPLTEGQSKDTVYVAKGAGALPTLDATADALTNLWESAGGKVPVLGNYVKSEQFQQAERAGREFVAAILRKETGAAVTPSEEQMYGDMYLPRPGDKPAVLADKKRARARALQAIGLGLPPHAILALEQAGVDPTGGGDPTAPAANPNVVTIEVPGLGSFGVEAID